MKNWNVPKTVIDVRSFLGFTNYYRRFIRGYAKVAKPLNTLVSGNNASHSLCNTEKNYPAHKLEFLALKWAITDRFHEYLYGGQFDVYTDNNPLTYILTSAKLDATGQRWVASLANYDF